MCTYAHRLLPFCQEGHYWTPHEQGSGLLRMGEIRGMFVMGDQDKRGKWTVGEEGKGGRGGHLDLYTLTMFHVGFFW